ncbi:MAG: sialidase family protein [Armatimonadia bacterium]
MGAIAGLTYPTIVEHNGLVYLTGYRDGKMCFRRSADGGRSWLRFVDGSEEKEIGPGEEARAGLVKVESGGRRLLAAVANGAVIEVYVSVDDGETWAMEGEV